MAYCRQCGNVTIAQNRDGTCSDCAMEKLLNKELAERDARLGYLRVRASIVQLSPPQLWMPDGYVAGRLC